MLYRVESVRNGFQNTLSQPRNHFQLLLFSYCVEKFFILYPLSFFFFQIEVIPIGGKKPPPGLGYQSHDFCPVHFMPVLLEAAQLESHRALQRQLLLMACPHGDDLIWKWVSHQTNDLVCGCPLQQGLSCTALSD